MDAPSIGTYVAPMNQLARKDIWLIGGIGTTRIQRY
jgi:hypothetical protein